jgi:hypothetical protein
MTFGELIKAERYRQKKSLREIYKTESLSRIVSTLENEFGGCTMENAVLICRALGLSCALLDQITRFVPNTPHNLRNGKPRGKYDRKRFKDSPASEPSTP